MEKQTFEILFILNSIRINAERAIGNISDGLKLLPYERIEDLKRNMKKLNDLLDKENNP